MMQTQRKHLQPCMHAHTLPDTYTHTHILYIYILTAHTHTHTAHSQHHVHVHVQACTFPLGDAFLNTLQGQECRNQEN